MRNGKGKGPTTFDFETSYEAVAGNGEEEVRVTGSIDPGEEPTGPTYDCGGTPGCGPTIDEFHIFVKIAGQWAEIEDREGKMADDLFDEIMESFGDDGPDCDGPERE